MASLADLRAVTDDGSLPSYQWPGGYPMEYLTRDGMALCPNCANSADCGPDCPNVQDPIVAGDVFWEGAPYPCDDCGKLIESAYGELVEGD